MSSTSHVASPAGETAWREEVSESPESTETPNAFPPQKGMEEGVPVALQVESIGTVEHPGATAFFGVCPWMRKFPVLGIAIEAFGPVFIFSLGSCYFLLKGVTDNIVSFSRQPMMTKRFGIDAVRYQRLAGISTMGTSIKAFIAVITDIFPLFGYTKRWYMVGSCLIGFAFTLGYGLLPAKKSSADVASGFIFLSVFARANVDLLSEGHYSRLIRRNTAAGPALVSWIWWMIMIGIIIASVIQGPLSDSGKVQIGVYVAAALHVIPCVIFVMNWYGEKKNREERHEDAVCMYEEMKMARRKHRAAEEEHGNAVPGGAAAKTTRRKIEDFQPEEGKIRMEPLEGENDDDLIGFSNAVALPEPDEVACVDDDDDDEDAAMSFQEPDIASFCCGVFEINKEVAVRNWKIVVYSVVMTCSVITMACVTILGKTWDLLYACVAVSVVCCVCAFLTLPLVIAKANVFTYFDFVLYISLPGVLDTFYVAKESCVPGGPQFSYSFYNTVGAVIQNVAGIIGVTMFTYVFSHMRYQIVICITVTLRVVASIFDLVMVERWNIYIGIPDHAMYVCGDTVIYNLAYELGYMPIVMMLSRVCPRGSESMVYALMAGFGNLGASMSNTIGSLLVELAWPINTRVTPCDYSNARWLIITGHLAVPLLIIPLGFLLLPSARICDDIDVNGHAIKRQVKDEAKEKEKKMAKLAKKAKKVDAVGPFDSSDTD
ncbi:folate/biopterin transporter [Lotmaria passim]